MAGEKKKTKPKHKRGKPEAAGKTIEHYFVSIRATINDNSTPALPSSLGPPSHHADETLYQSVIDELAPITSPVRKKPRTSDTDKCDKNLLTTETPDDTSYIPLKQTKNAILNEGVMFGTQQADVTKGDQLKQRKSGDYSNLSASPRIASVAPTPRQTASVAIHPKDVPDTLMFDVDDADEFGFEAAWANDDFWGEKDISHGNALSASDPELAQIHSGKIAIIRSESGGKVALEVKGQAVGKPKREIKQTVRQPISEETKPSNSSIVPGEDENNTFDSDTPSASVDDSLAFLAELRQRRMRRPAGTFEKRHPKTTKLHLRLAPPPEFDVTKFNALGKTARRNIRRDYAINRDRLLSYHADLLLPEFQTEYKDKCAHLHNGAKHGNTLPAPMEVKQEYWEQLTVGSRGYLKKALADDFEAVVSGRKCQQHFEGFSEYFQALIIEALEDKKLARKAKLSKVMEDESSDDD